MLAFDLVEKFFWTLNKHSEEIEHFAVNFNDYPILFSLLVKNTEIQSKLDSMEHDYAC